MTKSLDEIWTDIAEQRANYEAIINSATDTINHAREMIAQARAGLDALPVAKVRRPRKASKERSPEYEQTWGSQPDERPELVERARLPGAAELFPQGIERTGGKSHD